MEVFQDALENDPQYQEEMIKTQISLNDIRISASTLLPHVGFTAQPLTDNQTSEGAITANGLQPANNVYRVMDMRLSVAQPVFNMRNFLRLSAAKLSHQAACAHLNAEFQNLMLKVVKAYFNTLFYENNLIYYDLHKRTMAKQLRQVQERHRLGKANGRDVSNAQSALSVAESDYIDMQMQLMDRQQELAQITNHDYTHLSFLNDSFPLLSPQPSNLKVWIAIALKQNWTIKTNQLLVRVAKERVKQQFAGHLPVINAYIDYDSQNFHAKKGSLIVAQGSSSQKNMAAYLNLTVPIYSGGLITATTKKFYNMAKMDRLRLDFSLRETVLMVKQNYMRILADLQRIKNDKQAILSAKKLLRASQEQYELGSGNIMDVIQQQNQLIRTQINYNRDKYNYIIELLSLKKAAGTLSIEDLKVVNCWLKNNAKYQIMLKKP